MKNITQLIDPEVAPTVDEISTIFQGLNHQNLPEVRKHLVEINALARVRDSHMAQRELPKETVKKSTLTVPGHQGDITLYIYQPLDLPSNGPAMLWMHGGGYIMGAADDDLCRFYAEQCGCTFVSVDYQLAPEHPFPAGLYDCQDALRWLHRNARELSVDPNSIAIGGMSAGAGIAAGLALLNRDQKGPKICFQFLLYPMLDNLHDTPSGKVEGYIGWSREVSFTAWEMYLNGIPGKEASPYAAAARARNLTDLPPTYIAVGGQELFRDECIDYARQLMLANVPTELAVFPGLYHASEWSAPKAKVSQRMQQSQLLALRNGLGIQ